MWSRGAAHLQALDVSLQAGRAGPQLAVLVQLLQPGAQGLGWDPQSCPRPPHVPTRARAPHKPGRRPYLRCGEASHLQKSCRHRVGPWTPSPWRLLETSACSHGICHTHTGNMGDQATASTQPPPDAPSRRVPTPQHHHGSSVPSGLQHLWASPLFVTLSRPGPVFGGCPSGWARLGSSGDWTGCGSGESPPGAREELSFSTGSLFSFRLWPELGGCSRLVVPTGCMWGPSGCLHRHGPGVCSLGRARGVHPE